MAIIKYTKNYTSPDFALLNRYPDQFVSEKYKKSDDWWKVSMDYFYNVAIQQFQYNKRRFVPNYELLKGILRRADFYNTNELQSYTETLLGEEKLPKYVKHYSIMNSPIEDLVGELSKRPDNTYVKAFDDDSKSAELSFRTEILQKLIMQTVKEKIQAKYAEEGQQIDDEDELDKMTAEQAQEYLSSYTSTAEKWGARVLELMKVKFNIKDKSEEAFRDFLISGREFYHIFEDNSEFGFNMETLNPKNTWFLSTADQKYISDPLDRNNSAYAAGTIQIMEFSEVIHKFKLTLEEVQHLRNLSQQGYLLSGRVSPLVQPGVTGANSVQYDVYDPAVLQYRKMMESELVNNRDELTDLLGITSSAATFGNKFLVVRSYWNSKKKIGKLTFIDEDDNEQTIIVDENYKAGTHPQEISVEWGWINQWYQGVKIGLDIYYVKPLEILDYCPIIGALNDIKNIPNPPSLVDRMKPFQMLYNVAMNQLFRLLEKDMGVVFLTSIRHVPVPKDGDFQDALEMWETEAREKGIVFLDDSPENLQGGPSSFNQFQRMDLSRANEIQARYQLAIEMRNECWKLVGMSEQRLGESKATETATGINSSLTQSYAQTESLFAQHEYTLNKLYQALLDAALKIQSSKPESTISYISNEGESAFVKINGSDLKLKELGVLVTNRSEDARNFLEFRQLAQALIQNGALYEASLMYGTKSIRALQEALKKFKETQEAQQNQAQQIQQQQIEAQKQTAEQQMQLQLQTHQADQQFQAQENQMDRENKERIALISANAKGAGSDLDGNGVPDILETSKLALEQQKHQADVSMKQQDLMQKQQQNMMQNAQDAQNNELQKEKLRTEKYKIDKQAQIAKMKKPTKS